MADAIPARRADSPDNWRKWRGPALFSYGFRPFFLSAGAWGLLAVGLWLPQWEGHFALPSAFQPLDWHAHEMIFGYLGAAMAGFLLTAVPNWTGRLPVAGAPLMALWGVWVAGRLAVAFSAAIGAWLAMAIDVGFFVVFAAVAGREIVAGENWRNLRVLAVVALIGGADALFHVEAITRGRGDYGLRLGLAAGVAMIMLIGGRIVPSFTRNWLARRGPGRLPAPFDRFDAVSMAVAGVALALWVVAPETPATGVFLILGGLAQARRLWRWAPERTGGEALVWALHAAYAFVPLGFFATALAALSPGALAPGAALHAWGVGAVGGMTMAVMTRATRGHTGRALAADRATTLVYALIIVAALARLLAGFLPQAAFLSIHVAGFAWIAATGAFLCAYAPMLARPRKHAPG